MPTTTNTLPKKRRRQKKEPALPRLPQPSPSTPKSEEDLVSAWYYTYFDLLYLRLPMIGSVNGKMRFGRGHAYIDSDYARREKELIIDVQHAVLATGWQVAPEDSYMLFYTFHFDLPKSARQKTGDNHNPLKPFSDILVHGRALYDDDNTRGEWVESYREAGDDHWADIRIFRFRNEKPLYHPFHFNYLTFLLTFFKEPYHDPDRPLRPDH